MEDKLSTGYFKLTKNGPDGGSLGDQDWGWDTKLDMDRLSNTVFIAKLKLTESLDLKQLAAKYPNQVRNVCQSSPGSNCTCVTNDFTDTLWFDSSKFNLHLGGAWAEVHIEVCGDI